MVYRHDRSTNAIHCEIVRQILHGFVTANDEKNSTVNLKKKVTTTQAGKKEKTKTKTI